VPKEEKYASLAHRLDLFRGLSARDIETVFSKGSTLRFHMGETVFEKGAPGNLLYVILQGRAGVYDGDRLLAYLETGEIFGEMALVTREPRSATVVATTPAILFAITDFAFQNLLTKRVAVQLLLNMLRSLSRRIRGLNERVAGLDD